MSFVEESTNDRARTAKGLRCPDCLTYSPLGTFYCVDCGSSLLPTELMPEDRRRSGEPIVLLSISSAPETAFDEPMTGTPMAGRQDATAKRPQPESGGHRYHIMLGDNCPICRAASRISFTADWPPLIPVVGCQGLEGCRCVLPAFVPATPAAPGPAKSDAGARAAPAAVVYDHTTGTFTIEAFSAFAPGIVSEAMRQGLPLSLILVSFENQGVAPGAENAELATGRLRSLVEVLRRTVRTSDYIARFGPASFVVIAQGADEAGVMIIARRVQEAFVDAPALGLPYLFPTVSQAIATLPSAGTDLTELLQGAGEALAIARASDGGIRRAGTADESAKPRGRLAAPVAPDPDENSSTRTEAQSIPGTSRRWRDAALFGSDPKRRCKAGDLAEYLDLFPLLPVNVGLDLEPGEEAYLLCSARRGWVADGRASIGLEFPREGAFSDWVKQTPRPPSLPDGAVSTWVSGLLCLTNRRILLGRRGAGDTVSLADVASVEYLRGGLSCAVGVQGERFVTLLPNALQVGLCVARTLRDR